MRCPFPSYVQLKIRANLKSPSRFPTEGGKLLLADKNRVTCELVLLVLALLPNADRFTTQYTEPDYVCPAASLFEL